MKMGPEQPNGGEYERLPKSTGATYDIRQSTYLGMRGAPL